MQLWGGLDGFTFEWVVVCVSRNKNQKFLCRTELTGALGAILAQDQGHRKMNLSTPTHPEVRMAKAN